jgi:hypothetical protein
MQISFFSLGLSVQLASSGLITLFVWTVSGAGLAVASGLAMATFAVGTFFSYREVLWMKVGLTANFTEPPRERQWIEFRRT